MLTTAGAGEAVLAWIGNHPRLQGLIVEQEDPGPRVRGRRQQNLQLLEVSARPCFPLRERQRGIPKWRGKIEGIAGADPGDSVRPEPNQLLDAVHRVAGRRDREGLNLRHGVGTTELGLVVAADGQGQQIAGGEMAATRHEGRDFVCEAGKERNHVGVAGLGTADRIIRQRRQLVDRLQRVDEIGSLAEATGGIGGRPGRTREAEQAESATRRAAGVGIAVAKSGDAGECSCLGRQRRRHP